jgi:hypothetical protein
VKLKRGPLPSSIPSGQVLATAASVAQVHGKRGLRRSYAGSQATAAEGARARRCLECRETVGHTGKYSYCNACANRFGNLVTSHA